MLKGIKILIVLMIVFLNAGCSVHTFASVSACEKFPIEFKSYYYERIGGWMIDAFSYDILRVFDACYMINESFRNFCFVGVGKGLDKNILIQYLFCSDRM